MARKLRVQFEGARYHVINRGNYRSNVFGSKGATYAFVRTLEECAERFGWVIYAYVVMRNHYHLAIETPQANLSDGMHWLQTTFATRFNRLRGERGHLFQGRYQSILLEDEHAVRRVADYIHLNPVKANLVTIDQLHGFVNGSLSRLLKGKPSKGVCPDVWLDALGLKASKSGWRSYQKHLREIAGEETDEEVVNTWAVGSQAWRERVAKEHGHSSMPVGLSAQKREEMKRMGWETLMQKLLKEMGRDERDLAEARKNADWKVEFADRLRTECGAHSKWIGERLSMGSSGVVRVYLQRYRQTKS